MSAARIEAVGVMAGVALAGLLLVVVSLLLLGVEGAGVKVLAAVWLWLLPALGFGACLGWLAAKALTKLTGAGG